MFPPSYYFVSISGKGTLLDEVITWRHSPVLGFLLPPPLITGMTLKATHNGQFNQHKSYILAYFQNGYIVTARQAAAPLFDRCTKI